VRKFNLHDCVIIKDLVKKKYTFKKSIYGQIADTVQILSKVENLF